MWKRPAEGVSGFVAYEWQRRGSLHVHALLEALHGLGYPHVHEAWRKALEGAHRSMKGFSWVKPFRAGAAFYTAKYAAKEVVAGGGWQIFGPWWGKPTQLWFPFAG